MTTNVKVNVTLSSTLRKAILVILAIITLGSVAQAAPRIFFTDLDSGPATGGLNNNGVFVTIYGTGFGTAPTVTIGGGAAVIVSNPSNYLWYQKLVVQPGANAVTGNVVVTNVTASNGVAFTVRAGGIYFVAAVGGSDLAAGSLTAPWATIQHAVDTMAAGDTTYVRDGVVEARQVYDGSVQLNGGGSAGSPKAVVAYPGASVTIGATGTAACTTMTCYEGLKNLAATASYWTFAGINFRAQDEALLVTGSSSAGLNGWRVVGNDISCPWGGGTPDACLVANYTSNVKVLGNNVHDVGNSRAAGAVDSQYHAVYYSSDSNHIEEGWNQIANVNARSATQIHSTSNCNPSSVPACTPYDGFAQYDITLHDNVIHDSCCDGFMISSVKPESGAVTVYNNLFYNVGGGPLTANGGSYSGINIQGGLDYAGAPYSDMDGTVPVEVYNNTLFNIATGTVPVGAGFTPGALIVGNYSPNMKVHFRNNVVSLSGSLNYMVNYFTTDSGQGYGDHNLFFGSSAAFSSFLTNSATTDPQFVSTTAPVNFHLQSTSPARTLGQAITGLTVDLDGWPRASTGTISAGCYEFH